MPTYVYQCTACDYTFEKFQSFHDKPLHLCPECKKKSLKKIIHATGIIFKGPGFYKTDSRKKTSSVQSSSTASQKTPTKEKKDSSNATPPAKEKKPTTVKKEK